MKTVKLEIEYNTLSIEELNSIQRSLFDAARNAALDAYAPYSQYQVGAAVLLENGTIVTGNNQENAAYPSGLCAERVALFAANALYPNVAVQTIALAAFHNGVYKELISPCGACRQVFSEIEHRFGKKIQILLCGNQQILLFEGCSSLLPFTFDATDLESKN